MSSLINATVVDNLNAAPIVRIARPIRFWYFSCWNVVSLSCVMFHLYFLRFERTPRRALRNHIVIVLLPICFVDKISNIPSFIRNDQYETPWFLFTLQIGLFAWATLARHTFIFHKRWLNTAKNRSSIHYLPMITIVLYYLFCDLEVYFGVPCALTRTFLGV